jgi:hypothetical protein
MSDDTTRIRFLGAIAAQLPVDRVVELHLFGPIRQGGMESGVAVIAVDPNERVADERDDALALSAGDAGSPYAASETGDVPDDADVTAPKPAAPRYTVYTARYRHTLKGPDRGKWEASVTEEADAPLITVDAVVRGVSRRSGEADETVRLSGDEFRAAIPVPAGRTA